MASTRKSSRVRVPKIKEDGVTPTKRTKVNTASPVVAPTPVLQPQAALATPATLAPLPVIPAVVSTPAASSPVTATSGVSTPTPTPTPAGGGTGAEDMELSAAGTPDVAGDEIAEEKVATAVFKDPSFVHSTIGAAGSKRTRVWKNLKQIITTERLLPWQPSYVTYSSIEGPPSFKPAKKYSDLSGLEALYTDPQTKLRYATPDEFSRARTLPSDLVTGFLALRKASGPVP